MIALREARRKGVSEDDVYAVGTWGVIGGLVGARLLHVIDRWPEYAANPSAILAFQEGGLAIYGVVGLEKWFVVRWCRRALAGPNGTRP